MTTATAPTTRGALLADQLHRWGFGPFLGTPCGILAPLYSTLETHYGLTTIAREDNAIGIAAGAALSGRFPAVLMQNSGLGQSVNAIASLVSPYRLPMLLIVSMRGTDADTTEENRVMGRATEALLEHAGIPTTSLTGARSATQLSWAHDQVIGQRKAAAVLIPPSLFGWRP